MDKEQRRPRETVEVSDDKEGEGSLEGKHEQVRLLKLLQKSRQVKVSAQGLQLRLREESRQE